MNKHEWISTYQDMPGVFFASETTASEQIIKTETKQMEQCGFKLIPSAPIRPKRSRWPDMKSSSHRQGDRPDNRFAIQTNDDEHRPIYLETI